MMNRINTSIFPIRNNLLDGPSWQLDSTKRCGWGSFLEGAMGKEKPEMLKDEHLEYLDYLRESGATNMFGASPYLKQAYPELSKQDSHAILSYWMDTFSERHSQ